MGPHQGILPLLPLAPTPTHLWEKNLTTPPPHTQKITLKKSLFKKVLAARTVTKQKERRTNKIRRRLCPTGLVSTL